MCIPTGTVAAEAYRTMSAAMAEAGMAGLGRLTLSRRERMVLVESRGQGLALITLRAAEEVRAAEFDRFEGELDAEAVAIAGMIIQRKTGSFDPSIFRDRYRGGAQGVDRGEAERATCQGAPRGATCARLRFDGRSQTESRARDGRRGRVETQAPGSR